MEQIPLNHENNLDTVLNLEPSIEQAPVESKTEESVPVIAILPDEVVDFPKEDLPELSTTQQIAGVSDIEQIKKIQSQISEMTLADRDLKILAELRQSAMLTEDL